MNRCCGCLITLFRVIQLLLSLVLLAAGIFITREMLTMSGSAHQLETILIDLQNSTDTSQSIDQQLGIDSDGSDDTVQDIFGVLNKFLIPILRHLQGTPARAIVVAVVGLWSTIFIFYLIIAHYSTKHPNLNRQSIRVPLELVTLLLWIAAVVCAALLAMQYGVLVIGGGIETKIAASSLKSILKDAASSMIDDSDSSDSGSTVGKSLLSTLDIVNEIVKIGIAAIIALAGSVICGLVSLVSFILACCVTGKKKRDINGDMSSVGHVSSSSMTGYGYGYGPMQQKAMYHVTEGPWPGTHTTHHRYHGGAYQSA